MKKYFLLSAFCFLSAVCRMLSAQNLIPNWSFEQYSSCPNGPGQINKAIPWVNPTASSPEYYHGCSSVMQVPDIGGGGKGYQEARTGIAYAGIYAFAKFGLAREYIQVQLKDTLKAGAKYCVSFYVNLPEAMDYAVSSMGAYFSAIPVSSANGGLLPYVPQIANDSGNLLTSKTDWMPIQDTLLAAGGELYITIGNYNTDADSDTSYIYTDSTRLPVVIAYYLVDDVSVIPIIDAVDAGKDTVICEGDSVMLGVPLDNTLTYNWFPATGLNSAAVAQPIADPAVTTTYYLTINSNSCKNNIDSVTVTVINCDTLTATTLYIPNAFSPNGDGVNDTLQVKVKGAENISYFSFTVYNRWGEEVFKTNELTKGWDGMYNNMKAPEGVYVYLYSAVLNTEEPEIKKGNVTLIR